MARWIDEAKQAELGQIASLLGLEQGRGRSLTPCPSCQAVHRSESQRDFRGPVGVRADAHGWACHRCHAKGDALDLVAFAVAADKLRHLDEADRQRVWDWYADRGFCTPRTGHTGQSPKPVIGTQPVRSSVPAEVGAYAESHRPPTDEVERLWDMTTSVRKTLSRHRVGNVSVFLTLRKLERLDPALQKVVRVTPLDHDWPAWWPARWAKHFRLVTRAWEPDGRLGSLHARAVPLYSRHEFGKIIAEPARKTTWPKGCQAGELLFADTLGHALLKGQRPDGIDKVLIVEGLTDLMRATHAVACGQMPVAVVGGTSGSWRALERVKWPHDLSFYVATDPDPTGHKYAQEIIDAIWRGCQRKAHRVLFESE